MSDTVNGIVGATLGVGKYVVNDYVIELQPAAEGYGYTMTVRRGTETQTAALYGLTPAQYDAMAGMLEAAQAARDGAQADADRATNILEQLLEVAPEDYATLVARVSGVEAALEDIFNAPRFGVSGVGGSATELTRIWDSVGRTATPSTDSVEGHSDFDGYAPFNRRKCVGSWSAGDGRAVFTVRAYEGDPDYAEDGTMGDFVAVEVTPFYYYEQDGVLGVSALNYPGWRVHPVCVDGEGRVRARTYLPCYALALKDGRAVSLPGLNAQYGGYLAHRQNAMRYADAGAAQYAVIEPTAVWHYEWLLQTIEFATQNMQSVMAGATNMRRNAADVIQAVPGPNRVVVGPRGADFVVGQMVYLIRFDENADVSMYNAVTALQKCAADGTPDDSGAYWLVTYGGPDRSAAINVRSSAIESRPWITGATAGWAPGVSAVLGHTGSPVDNQSGRYPMRYRWRENVYGNINVTALDLAAIRVSEGGDHYRLEWYYLSDPAKFTPANFDREALTDPAGGWVKLDADTPQSSYANGYIAALAADPRYPHVKTPCLTTGGGADLYYGDYAYLVYAHEVRTARRGGHVNGGTAAGPCFCNALHAPAASGWYYGATLNFLQ